MRPPTGRPTFAIAAALLAAFAPLACGNSDDGSASPPDDGCPAAAEPEEAPPIRTPRWAFDPWISKDISTTDDTYDFVKGFVERDIPVGTVVLDSPWETNYNTFVPDPVRYHDFAKLVSDLHADGRHLVLWITQFLNFGSFDFEPNATPYDGGAPDYDLALRCGLFIDDGATYTWWKGRGGAIDFLNPRAVAFWHAQQDAVLATGIDGWKLDFGDSYVRHDPVKTAAGEVPHQTYSEAYYRDYRAHGMKVRGDDFVTMVRAWDESYDFAGRFYARKEDAPVVWAGDNRRDWVGLADALDETFRSANAGYVVLGSDVGGYLDKDDKDITGPSIPFDTLVFARWTAIGALSPFMQLHGRANITPWTVPDHADETVALYRYWSKLHHELVPFFFSVAEETYAGRAKLVVPLGDEPAWAGDYRYVLGDAFLVAPILDATGVRDVPLPAGARYYDFFRPQDDAHDGGTTIADYDATERAKVPLFVREGAIVPLDVGDDVTGLGTSASKGALTLLVYPAASPSSFPLHEEDGSVTTIEAQGSGGAATVTLSAVPKPTIVRLRADVAPTTATLDGTALAVMTTRAAFDAAASGFYVDATNRFAWVKIAAASGAHTVAIAP